MVHEWSKTYDTKVAQNLVHGPFGSWSMNHGRLRVFQNSWSKNLWSKTFACQLLTDFPVIFGPKIGIFKFREPLRKDIFTR